MTTRELKDAIRHPYAWPGGYPLFAITSDGAALHLSYSGLMFHTYDALDPEVQP